jgi:zinc transport system substrate-binding protein
MEGVGEPALLVPAGVSDHAYALKPSDLRAIGSADLVVWIGPPLETYLVKPLETEGARSLPLIESESVDPRPYDTPGRAGHEAHGHDDHSDHSADSEPQDPHASSGLDPHVWLDPLRARAMVTAIAEALTELDPDNAERYRANAGKARGRLETLDTEIRQQLAPLAAMPFVTFHDGYTYFVERYGLNQVGQLVIDPERSPGAATLKALQEKMAVERAACVFAEPQFDPQGLKTLAGEAKVKVGVLDAIGSGLQPGPPLYESLIRRNVHAIQDCLSPPT